MTQGPQTQKKGLSPLAWIAIGCGGLAVVGAIVAVIAFYFIGMKAKEMVEEIEKNPALATAKLIDLADPSIEITESDEAAQTVTFVKTETGEEFVISFEDIENGNLSWTTSEGSYGINTSEMKESGQVTYTTPEGEARLGTGSSADIPDWVLLPPNAFDVESSFSVTTADASTGAVSAKSRDSLDAVKAYYQTELEAAGYEVSLTSYSAGGQRQDIVSGTKDSGKQVLNAAISSQEGQAIQVIVQYQGPGQG